MITEDYVSFEVAKLLKDKGFDGVCRAFYKCWPLNPVLYKCDNTQVFDYCTNSSLTAYNYIGEEMNIAAPTHQMVCKWLREVHKIHIDVIIEGVSSCIKYKSYVRPFKIIYPLRNYDSINSLIIGRYNSYEEAVEAALKYVLENLI